MVLPYLKQISYLQMPSQGGASNLTDF